MLVNNSEVGLFSLAVDVMFCTASYSDVNNIRLIFLLTVRLTLEMMTAAAMMILHIG